MERRGTRVQPGGNLGGFVTLALHIAGGGLGIVTGLVALSVLKGGTVHRRVGLLFVLAMLTSALTGFTMAVLRNAQPELNVPASLLTAYLAATAFLTIRPTSTWSRRVVLIFDGVAGAAGLWSAWWIVESVRSGDGAGVFAYLLFFIFALVGIASDFRARRAGGLRGTARLTQHLWRMCAALFIAVISFFVGQPQAIPEAIRHPLLQALPVIGVVGATVYWLIRVRRGWRMEARPRSSTHSAT